MIATYRSTRGGEPVTFGEAVRAGLAPDGGLYWPTAIVPLPAGWRAAPTPAALAGAVLAPYMGEATASAVATGLDFPWPVTALGDDVFLLELFHGPTAAFKDVGARSLARAVQASAAASGRRVTVLVATSGDTGSAVADAFAGLGAVRVAVLYPAGGVSRVQEDQLTADRPGVRAFAVAGTFDDCQRLVKAAFSDPALAEQGLSSANSINVGRLLPQALYYLWAAARTAELSGQGGPPHFVVPSGNLGNLTAGLLAAEAGMTAGGFIAAHNRNDYFPRFLAGEVGAYEFSSSVATPSNAMDVGAPSNFERLHAWLGDDLRSRVAGVRVSDEETLEAMHRTFVTSGRQVCPHTAVGLEAVRRLRQADPQAARPAVVLATAHPAKFPDAVLEATGVPVEVPPSLEKFAAAPKRVERLEADPAALRQALLGWDD